jgi:hypothetical protein
VAIPLAVQATDYSSISFGAGRWCTTERILQEHVLRTFPRFAVVVWIFVIQAKLLQLFNRGYSTCVQATDYSSIVLRRPLVYY